MLKKNPRSPLARYVDPARIARDIRRFAGTTIAAFDAGRPLAPETDFLDAGCRRDRELLRQ